MTRSFRLASICILFLLAVTLSAFANSNNNFSNVSLTGVSGTVAGSFTFNSSNNTFSNLCLSFNGGVFGGNNANSGGGKGICAFGLCGYSWKTQLANGDWVWDSIVLNLKTGQYQDFGGIYNWKQGGGFDYMSVSEGGNPLGYLLLSGFAMLTGILISGKRRRMTSTAQSN
jgi:hypothetical protein